MHFYFCFIFSPQANFIILHTPNYLFSLTKLMLQSSTTMPPPSHRCCPLAIQISSCFTLLSSSYFWCGYFYCKIPIDKGGIFGCLWEKYLCKIWQISSLAAKYVLAHNCKTLYQLALIWNLYQF